MATLRLPGLRTGGSYRPGLGLHEEAEAARLTRARQDARGRPSGRRGDRESVRAALGDAGLVTDGTNGARVLDSGTRLDRKTVLKMKQNDGISHSDDVPLTVPCTKLKSCARVLSSNGGGPVAQQHDSDDWRSEFQPTELEALRERIPTAIQRSHDRSARAQTAYDDPDGDQDVYGAGMARGAQKELRSLLSDLPSYREAKVPPTRRMLTFVGNTLIFLHRVGKQMPQDYRRVRLSYLPDSRRELLSKTSNSKYSDPGLFDIGDVLDGDKPASLEDALNHVELTEPGTTLFVPYYSSTPRGVGTIYFAPARLNGQYLEFADPERLTYERTPSSVDVPRPMMNSAAGFNSGDRPRTPVKLRQRPPGQESS